MYTYPLICILYNWLAISLGNFYECQPLTLPEFSLIQNSWSQQSKTHPSDISHKVFAGNLCFTWSITVTTRTMSAVIINLLDPRSPSNSRTACNSVEHHKLPFWTFAHNFLKNRHVKKHFHHKIIGFSMIFCTSWHCFSYVNKCFVSLLPYQLIAYNCIIVDIWMIKAFL